MYNRFLLVGPWDNVIDLCLFHNLWFLLKKVNIEHETGALTKELIDSSIPDIKVLINKSILMMYMMF